MCIIERILNCIGVHEGLIFLFLFELDQIFFTGPLTLQESLTTASDHPSYDHFPFGVDNMLVHNKVN